jgi:serine/threonine protein kinase
MVFGKLPFSQQTSSGSLDYTLDWREQKNVSSDLKNLLENILNVDSRQRLTAAQILNHPWFNNTPVSLDIFDEQERDLI